MQRADPASPAASERLAAVGWSDDVARRLADSSADGRPGRVITVERGWDTITTADEDLTCPRAHPLFRNAQLPPPAVGDWVVIDADEHGPAIVDVIERATAVTRRDPAERDTEQVVAANVDVVAIVAGLDRPLNSRRLERALVLAHESGATPLLVLTKADLPEAAPAIAREVATAVMDPDAVVAVSNETGDGIVELHERLRNKTTVLFGASGVGKSALVNALADDELAEVGEVRARDRKGRHTTTRRQLIPLGGGATVIDTPGVRALGLWDAEDGLEQAFPDIEALAADCRFADCRHDAEPGCAVREAVEAGTLSEARRRSYVDLSNELERLRDRREEQRWRRGGRRR
ncbi:MAG: ribosome small subunit-dependent GTPase A [Actinomycetota bacterium]|nr:ribosome small subunit-dependent GTPase A [Actinomycetota bacterium]